MGKLEQCRFLDSIECFQETVNMDPTQMHEDFFSCDPWNGGYGFKASKCKTCQGLNW